jgi:Fe2+ transport system protein FeoA
MKVGTDDRTVATATDPSRPDPIRLDQLAAGHCGTVREVLAGEEETERLMAMGVCTGRKVMLVRRGDPLILKVLASRIGVSARLAARVVVWPCGEELCSPEREPRPGGGH